MESPEHSADRQQGGDASAVVDALLARIREIRAKAAGVYVIDADLRVARDEGRP
jgi:hypothetical protein